MEESNKLAPGTPVRNPETGERGVYQGESPVSTYTHVVTIPGVGMTGLHVTSLKNWKTIELDPDGCVFDWGVRPAPEGTEWRLVADNMDEWLRDEGSRVAQGVVIGSNEVSRIIASYCEANHTVSVAPEIEVGMWVEFDETSGLESVYPDAEVGAWLVLAVTDSMFVGVGLIYDGHIEAASRVKEAFRPCDALENADELLALLGVTES